MKGVFIDFDGTLVDSIPLLRDAYFSFLEGFSIQGAEPEFQGLNGPPVRELVKTLQDKHDLPGAGPDLITRYMDLIQMAHAAASPAAGAVELLSRARDQGWKVAVVTSSPQTSAKTWLKRNGVAHCVDIIVGGDDVDHGKPHPEPYMLALTITGCSPEQSIAIEDSKNGARSAVDAGLTTYAIGDAQSFGWPDQVSFIRGLPDLIDKL